MSKENNQLSILEPFIFKYIFGTTENIKYTKALLADLFSYDIAKLENLKIINKEIDFNDLKNIDYNVVLTLSKSLQIVLKSYNSLDENGERMIFAEAADCWLKNASRRGTTLTDIPNLIYVAFIKDANNQNNEVIRKYSFGSFDSEDDRYDNIKYVIVNASANEYVNNDIKKAFEVWRKFLSASSIEEITELAGQNLIIKEILEKIKNIKSL